MNTTFGRYRLLERLGQGGMAEVFKAKSYGVEGFEKVVVIKKILPQLAESELFVAMFIHEAKLAVRLSHANVVQVFDLGLAPGTVVGGMPQPDGYYMAMEYVNGFDLATVLSRCRRQQTPIPIEMAVYVAAEVAKGLDHAHRRRDEQNQPLNIVHRDVSPQNVLISLDGEVKVTDFGIAKARGVVAPLGLEDTRARQLEGKLGYMSPEQALGENVDARSDLFSLGTLLYEMLTGVNPFTAPTSFETLRRVCACEAPPAELLRPDIPTELIGILKTVMSLDPDDRYPDAGRMYEALLAFLYSQGRRFSAHNLADYLSRFRSPDETGPQVVLDAEAVAQERTPVEVPTTGGSQRPSITKVEPATVVDVERAATMGERREVTVLVVDLPNRDDVETAEQVAAGIARYGGRIVSREPTQIAALFGTDEPDGRDTEVATRCALVILRSLAGERPPSAGLHVGRVHLSSDGAPTEDERLASLVSVARDLARSGEGTCAMSAAAMRQVRNLFVFDSPTEARGSSPPVGATFHVREVRGPSEAFGRFVGRKDELRTVGEMLAKATRRTATALTIRGDHGIGKTRLLLEVERRLRKGGYNVGWHFATCLPRGTDHPLSGIQAMLQSLCGIVDGDSDARIRQVVPRLRALGLQDDEVGAVLGALGASSVPPLGNARGSLVNAFTRMVLRLCEDRPHAFAWDAAHSLDGDSYAVLEAMLTKIPQARTLIVLSARAGFSHGLEAVTTHRAVDLSDLRQEDAERLVEARLGIERVPAELLRFVRDRAAGHPQMIEEVLKALVEGRAVTVAEGAVVSMKLVGQDLALPKTLRGLVASRIARFTGSERAILQAAAVLGPPIHTEVLAQMTGLAVAALERSIAAFEEGALLVHASPAELTFSSPIVREVILDALTPEASREMHAAAGRALEETLGDASIEQAARIATHSYEAGQRERAATYFAKSADRRLEKGQLDAATRDFARAIELCDVAAREPKEIAGWLSGLAKAVRLVRSLPGAFEMCERVIARIDKSDELDLRVRVRIDAGRILGALHLFDAARAQFVAAEAIAQDRSDLVKSALVTAAEFAVRQGDFKRSLSLLERLAAFVTTGTDKSEEYKLMTNLVQTSAAMGEHALALRYLERLAVLATDDSVQACERHKLRALVDFFARDFRAAALHCERGVDMARDLGLPYEVAVNLHNLGDVLIHSEDYPRAYGAVKQSLALCEEYGHERLASHNRMFLAFLDGRAGDADAEPTLQQGIRYAESNDFTWDLLGGRLLLAKLFEQRGEADAARLEYQKLRELARGVGNRVIADDCAIALQSMGASSQPPPPL